MTADQFNVDAEKAVLGAMLFDPGIALEIFSTLPPESFWEPKHREIYLAQRYVFHSYGCVDLTAVCDRLNSLGKLQEVGDATYVAALEFSALSSSAAMVNAEIVREKAILREIGRISKVAQQESATGKWGDPKNTVEFTPKALIEKVIGSLQTMVVADGWDAKMPLDEIVDEIASRDGTHSPGTPVGFAPYDHHCGGIRGGQFIPLGATAGVGKSTLVVQICWYYAQLGMPTFYHSGEMDKELIVTKILSLISGIDSRKIERGINQEEYFRPFERACEIAKKYIKHIHIVANSNLTVDQVAMLAKAEAAKRGRLAVVVQDHLGLLNRPQGYSERESYSHTTKTLKGLAMDLHSPVIALSHLNERDESIRPGLHNFKASSSIEGDADQCWFLWKNPDDVGLLPENQDLLTFIVAKNRAGATGEFKLRYNKAVHLLEPYEDDVRDWQGRG